MGRYYSVDLRELNPIEQAFSRIKHAMRTAQQRTVEALLHETGRIVQAISDRECRNYIAAAGYDAAKT